MQDKKIVLLTSSLAGFFISYMSVALVVALPIINREFHVDAILLSWVVTIYFLTMAIFSVPFGRIADIVGIKKTYLLGMIVYSIGTSLAIFSNSASTLIIFRALQGIGAAMVFTNALALLTAIFPPNERGGAFGVYLACMYAGSSAGPFIAGFVTERFGWTYIFTINIPACLLIILLLLLKIKDEWCPAKGERFDYLGSAVYGITLLALMYGISVLPEMYGVILIFLGILGSIGFLKWEKRVKSPLINVIIFFKNKIFLFSSMAAMVNYIAVFALTFILSMYLQYIRGLTPEKAGLILVTQPLVMALFSPISGKLSDKIKSWKVASYGMALTCLGLLLFTFLSEDTSFIYIILSLVVVGSGFALFISSNSNTIMSSVEPKYYGVASAITGTMRNVGQTLSMGITMIILAVIVGRVVISPEYYPALLKSTKMAFGIFTVICFLGIFASLYRKKI